MHSRATIVVLALASLVLAESGGSAAQPPAVSVQKLEALPIREPAPYDTSADAESQLKAALAKAKSEGKRVLVDMGGNWCPDCVILSNIMLLPEVAPFVNAHYEIVLVDMGRFNKNMQIPRRYGVNERIEGAPALLVLDADGKLLNAGHLTELDTARSMQPQAIVDWLAKWAGGTPALRQ
jgi:thiol-disulfide isomerase/thioredoxin